MGFIANLILNAPVKELWKSVNIWRIYDKKIVALAFGPPCIINSDGCLGQLIQLT